MVVRGIISSPHYHIWVQLCLYLVECALNGDPWWVTVPVSHTELPSRDRSLTNESVISAAVWLSAVRNCSFLIMRIHVWVSNLNESDGLLSFKSSLAEVVEFLNVN